MPDIKESSNNHFVVVGSLFVKEAQQRVIKENGQLVTPAYAKENQSHSSKQSQEDSNKK